MTVELNNIETNRPASDLQYSTTNNCTFDSSAPNNMPSPFYAGDYNISDFVYTQFGFTNPGKGTAFWSANGYPTGIGFAFIPGAGGAAGFALGCAAFSAVGNGIP